MPFLLLPFRPTSDPSAARTFVRHYFSPAIDGGEPLRGEALEQELRLTEPMVRDDQRTVAGRVSLTAAGALQRNEMVLEPPARRRGYVGGLRAFQGRRTWYGISLTCASQAILIRFARLPICARRLCNVHSNQCRVRLEDKDHL